MTITTHTAFSTLGDLPVEIEFEVERYPGMKVDLATMTTLVKVSNMEGVAISHDPEADFGYSVKNTWKEELTIDLDPGDDEDEDEGEEEEESDDAYIRRLP